MSVSLLRVSLPTCDIKKMFVYFCFSVTHLEHQWTFLLSHPLINWNTQPTNCEIIKSQCLWSRWRVCVVAAQSWWWVTFCSQWGARPFHQHLLRPIFCFTFKRFFIGRLYLVAGSIAADDWLQPLREIKVVLPKKLAGEATGWKCFELFSSASLFFLPLSLEKQQPFQSLIGVIFRGGK